MGDSVIMTIDMKHGIIKYQTKGRDPIIVFHNEELTQGIYNTAVDMDGQSSV